MTDIMLRPSSFSVILYKILKLGWVRLEDAGIEVSYHTSLQWMEINVSLA